MTPGMFRTVLLLAIFALVVGLGYFMMGQINVLNSPADSVLSEAQMQRTAASGQSDTANETIESLVSRLQSQLQSPEELVLMNGLVQRVAAAKDAGNAARLDVLRREVEDRLSYVGVACSLFVVREDGEIIGAEQRGSDILLRPQCDNAEAERILSSSLTADLTLKISPERYADLSRGGDRRLVIGHKHAGRMAVAWD